jgi:hypothetical protein
MQRHQSSMCTLAQSLTGLSRSYPVLGDVRAACNAHYLSESLPTALPQWVRPSAHRLQRAAGIALMSMVKPLGVALYVVLAILAMGLVLRFSGVSSSQAFSAVGLHPSADQASQAHEQSLNGRAQEILVSLQQDGQGFTVDGQ